MDIHGVHCKAFTQIWLFFLLCMHLLAVATQLMHLPLVGLLLSALLAMWLTAIHRRKIRTVKGSLSFIFNSFHWCLHVLVVLALGSRNLCTISGAANPTKTGPCMPALIPSHSFLPCYYLLSSDARCVTTGSSSRIFLLVNEETPHTYIWEFRCAFLHTRVNRICYLFLF